MNEIYKDPSLKRVKYNAPLDEEKKLLAGLDKRNDAEANRIKRYLAMTDLSRQSGSPIAEIIGKVLQLSTFQNFDDIHIPEIVPASESFDLFDFPADHPTRSHSDTYYVDDKNILKTHTTVMWYYYLNLPEVKKRITENKNLGVVCYGKVYRKDEIDRNHMNIFHQIDGLYICPKEYHVVSQQDLKDVLIEVAQEVFGQKIKYRFNPDSFPFTFGSLEMEIERPSADVAGALGTSERSDVPKEQWVEVLGAGIVQPTVLAKLGVDSSKYNGWAFGFGLERLAIISMELPDIRLLWSEDSRVQKQLKLGQKFVEVSKYPPIVRDISFVVNKDVALNNYFDLVRDTAGDLVEEFKLLDTYENAEKFGEDFVSYAFRITYRSLDRTLTSTEVDALHKKLEQNTVSTFKAVIREK